MAPITLPFPEGGYAVIHNNNGFALLLDCAAGSEITTGQPYAEAFTLEQAEEALASAIELGYTPPLPTENPEDIETTTAP
jgi:hypothetical protein